MGACPACRAGSHDPRFTEVVDYVRRISDEQGLAVQLDVEGDLVTVT